MKPILGIGSSNNDFGYTLLEILAVIALVGLIFSLAVPSFINREEKLLLNQIANLVNADFGKLRMEAIANRNEVMVEFSEKGYHFELDDNKIERIFGQFSFRFVVPDEQIIETAEVTEESLPKDHMQLVISSEGTSNVMNLEWESVHFKGVLMIDEDAQVEWVFTSK